MSDKATRERSSLSSSPAAFGLLLVALLGVALISAPRGSRRAKPGPTAATSQPTIDASHSGPPPELEPLLRDAEEASKAGHQDQALQLLKEAHRRAPEEAITNAQLGGFLCRLGRYQEAEPYIARARQLNPEQARYAGLYATCLSKLKRHEEALVEVAEGCRLVPGDPDLLLLASSLSLSAREIDAAISYAQLLLTVEPEHRAGLQLLARGHKAAGRAGSSADAWARYLTLEPDDFDAHRNHQEIALEAGRGDATLQSYKARYEAAPTLANARLFAKVASRFPARFTEAARALAEALEANPEDPQLRLDTASLAYLSGEFSKATELLAPLLSQTAPPRVRLESLLVSALLARVTGQLERARELFAIVETFEGRLAELGRLSLLRDEQKYLEALTMVDKMLRAAGPNSDSQLAYVAGEIHEEAGKIGGAMTEYRKSLTKKAPARLHESVGRMHMIMGQYDRAAHAFSAAIPRGDDQTRTALERTQVWRAVALLLDGNEAEGLAQLRDAADSPRGYLPYVSHRDIARHLLGRLDTQALALATRYHTKGPYFINDHLFFEGFKHELTGDKERAIAAYRKARAATIVNDSPARLIDARLKALITGSEPE